ncbi:hypothetical protein ACU6U9_07405 [Pseudomonas sp. HK3]
MIKGSLYSVGDKALYDALNQSKVTNSDLKSLFLSRGIIVSKSTNRENIARTFSRFTHGYNDYHQLSLILGNNKRRDRVTSTRINNNINSETIETALDELKSSIINEGAIAEVISKNGNYIVKINYKKTDFSKSEFKQVTDKESIISLECTSSNIVIRAPYNSETEEWKCALVDNIEREHESELNVTEISLSHIQDSQLRTEFFKKLVVSLKSYELVDVTDVFVFHPKEEYNEETDTNIGIRIDKASLKGVGVLESSELNDLHLRGFYISKIIWTAKERNLVDSDKYVLEAQFSDPDEFNNFNYLAKGFYRYISANEFSKSKTLLSNIDETKINIELENSAKETIDYIENLNESNSLAKPKDSESLHEDQMA